MNVRASVEYAKGGSEGEGARERTSVNMGLQPLVREIAGSRGTGLQPLVRVGAGSTSAGARLYLGSVLLPRQPEQLQAERRLALLPPLELERRQRLRVRGPLRRLALLARFGRGRGRADGDGAQPGW